MGSLLMGKQIKKNFEKAVDFADKKGLMPLAGVAGEQIVKQRKKVLPAAPTILKEVTMPVTEDLL